MTEAIVAATQMACGHNRAANVETAQRLVRQAAGQGANIILLQELFESCGYQKCHPGRSGATRVMMA